MIFSKQGNTTVITQESVSLLTFIKRVNDSYQKMKNDNLIINLFSLGKLNTNDLLEFLNLSNKHRKNRKSFVIVTNKVSFDEIPEELEVVRKLQEAYDIVEMEEIERDLEF